MRDVKLNEQQAAFVLHYTSTPGAIGNASEAARRAGYSEASANELGYQLLRKPHIREAVDEALRRQVTGPLAAKSVALLEKIIDDETAPQKVRLDAAKAVLDRAGWPNRPAAGPREQGDNAKSSAAEAENAYAEAARLLAQMGFTLQPMRAAPN
jgi:phage terminase small subunit